MGARWFGTWCVALAVVLASGPVSAQESPAPDKDSGGEVAASGQLTSISGNESEFREQSLGMRDGLNLEKLGYWSLKPGSNLHLDSRFTAGGSGWLDLDVTNDNWRFGVHVTRVNRWSADGFANDVLPSGTDVATLYPGTTELPSWLGPSLPSEDMLWGQAWVTYRFNRANRLTLRVGGTSLDGDRVPSIGGFSFSDVGTASFYTAGIEHDDSSSVWGVVEGRFHIGAVAVAADAGLASRDDRQSRRLPAYGQDQLLDLNVWEEKHSVDTAWARLAANWEGRRWGVSGAVAWTDVSSDPAGGDRREDIQGNLVRDGLGISGGSIDSDSFSGAVAVSWRPVKTLFFSLAGDALSASSDGGLDLSLGGSPFVPARSSMDTDRAGGTALARWSGRVGSLQLRLRGVSSEVDLQESRDPFSQDVERSADRWDVRLDGKARLSDRWRLRGWARWRDDDVSVDVKDLWNGYVPGDWERQTTSGLVALDYRDDSLTFGLTGAVADSDVDSSLPWLDPVFDPSRQRTPVSSTETWRRIVANVLWTPGRGSLWGELGWITGEYDLPALNLAGGQPTSEKVSGTVAVLGGDIGAWEGGTVSGQVEWISNGDDLDRDIIRSWLRIEQRIRRGLNIFLRWSYWDYSNSFASSAEYTANVFAAGVRASF